jgi:hypothetical protein
MSTSTLEGGGGAKGGFERVGRRHLVLNLGDYVIKMLIINVGVC